MQLMLMLGQLNALSEFLDKGEKNEKSYFCWIRPLMSLFLLIACGEKRNQTDKQSQTTCCTTNGSQ